MKIPETPKIEKKNEVPFAPEGWMTNGGLRDQLDTSYPSIKIIADQYRTSNPEYFKYFKAKGGPVHEHYSPELVTKIISELQKIEKVIPGWKTVGALSKELKTGQLKVSAISELHRKKHPEYFRNFKSDSGPIYEYFSPQLIDLIVSELKKTEKVIPGWKTNKSLQKELGTGQETVSDIADKYRDSHPEYFKNLKPEKGQTREHYAPELVDLIVKEIETTTVPDGWETNNIVHNKLNVGERLIGTIANKYRDSHPEYFKYFRSRSGLREHYAPELVSLIAKEVGEFESPPTGWKTNYRCAIELGIGTNTLSDMVQDYRTIHPNYFKQYRVPNKEVREHYAPELIAIIKNKLEEKNKQFPEVLPGWKTITKLFHEVYIPKSKLNTLINEYRKTHSECFRFFRTDTGVFEYISPDLISIIKEKINSILLDIQEAPDNWQAIEDLAGKTGLSIEDIRKLMNKHKKENPNDIGKFKDRE